jgi:hypothetical protein
LREARLLAGERCRWPDNAEEITMHLPTRTAATTLFAIAALVALPVAAHPSDPRVNQRHANQAGRIAEGVASGALTARETTRLLAAERVIRGEERAYKSDGVLTPLERADLHRDLNRASRSIALQKRDGERRF